jgi:lipopolysaccharide export LptBFGC system permease protein LptF
MTMLDRYVGRIAAGAFAAALAFFLFLSVLVDLLGNVSRYADRAFKAGLSGFDLAVYLAGYYAKLLPVLVTTVAPFATVIAGMFAVARLQQANEVVPMLFTGRSIRRILRPMVMLGVLSALGMAACWQWVVPRVGADLATAETFLRVSRTVHKNLVHELRDDGARLLQVIEFDPVANLLVDVRMIDRGPHGADVALTRAARASWDADRGDWRLEGGRIERTRRSEPIEWLGRPDLTPAVLVAQSRDTIDPEMLSYTDLQALMLARPNRADVKLAYHRHITWPLANVLLLLLVLPLAVHFERGSRLGRVLGAIGLCTAYMLVDLTCQSLGKRGVNPVVLAWAPPILFGSLGTVLYGSSRT